MFIGTPYSVLPRIAWGLIMSYVRIASALNKENIPAYYSQHWTYSSVRTILQNEAYTGNLIWNMYDYSTGRKMKDESEWIRFENAHPAIISHEVFALAHQSRIQRIHSDVI
jgi:site-specific DNA recombinase